MKDDEYCKVCGEGRLYGYKVTCEKCLTWTLNEVGVLQLGTSRDGVRITAQDFTGMTRLTVWYPKSDVEIHSWYSTLDRAKAEGEHVMRRVTS